MLPLASLALTPVSSVPVRMQVPAARRADWQFTGGKAPFSADDIVGGRSQPAGLGSICKVDLLRTLLFSSQRERHESVCCASRTSAL